MNFFLKPKNKSLDDLLINERIYPLLIAYLSLVRQLKSIQNAYDVRRKNNQVAKELNYWRLHKLFFLLMSFAKLVNTKQNIHSKARLGLRVSLIKKN